VIRIEGPVAFNCWGEERNRIVVVCKVVDQNKWEGTQLKMFVEYNEDWRYVPRSAKLYKLMGVVGCKMVVGADLNFSRIFRGKIFKAQLKHTNGRTIVVTFTQKVAGALCQ
jgi:hypothetical protein